VYEIFSSTLSFGLRPLNLREVALSCNHLWSVIRYWKS